MRKTWVVRGLMLPVLTALAAGAFPASGAAAARHSELLVAGPVQVHAYKMYLLATPAQRQSPSSLTMIFQRGTENDRQWHYYGFTHGVSVRIAQNGLSASIAAELGSYGHVRMSFSPGAGQISLPPVCNGKTVAQHTGSLSGSNGFDVLTHSSYFGEVRQRSLPAYVTTVRGNRVNCKPKQSTPTHGVTQLDTVMAQSGRALTSFTASHTARGFISEDVLLVDTPASVTEPVIIHSIDVSALPASAFTFASDLSSAHVAGSGKFLSGSFDFTQTVPETPNFVLGTVAGTVTAHFDGVGPVQPQVGAVETTMSK